MPQPLDAIPNSIIDQAPKSWRPYLQLSRFDRPIGFWLLGLPCVMGQALGRIGEGFAKYDLFLLALWLLGAIAMRGAGCTINDIIDRDIDAKVERTKNRPLACGAISTKQAAIWLGVQLLVGLGVLLALPQMAQLVALCAIPLVIAYPFMKRITWWPQAWLGITFNWGVLVGYTAVTGTISLAAVVFWLGAVFWTLGYDTIYAMSDVDDDALIGVKSTARRFGDKAPMWVGWFYFVSMTLFALAAWLELDSILVSRCGSPGYETFSYTELPKISALAIYAGLPAFALAALHLYKQKKLLGYGSPDFIAIFRSNRTVGLRIVVALACIVFALWRLEHIYVSWEWNNFLRGLLWNRCFPEIY
ncbi:MAG: 4-hydroxybenzoate octaprenyltransferase [Hyphomonadaceae bacterium]|nr:MAG: 4-hydroxybenzoate octaprenyltransferase [Hyphomonadaceae bacterium]KAF0184355.1 MAG: 4-hydroxybenzoate octaprenyltransferase [Hyphomonadaceae bacterium]